VMSEMERRIASDMEGEISTAVEQIGHIAKARLVRKFEAP